MIRAVGKWLVAGWLSLVVAATCAAQEPIPAPKGAPVPAADCPAPCVNTVKVCVPVPDIKKIATVVYGCKTKDFCLPACSCNCFKHGHGCKKGCCEKNCDQPCDLGKCEHYARTKRVLLKKVVTEECPSVKCVVEERPCVVQCPARCAEPAPQACGNRCQAVPQATPVAVTPAPTPSAPQGTSQTDRATLGIAIPPLVPSLRP